MPAERLPASPPVPLGAAPERLPQTAVRLDGVTKRFGSFVALHEARLEVRRGEVMTLLGPSGCGKTTLLNLVAGFLAPDEGAISIGGEDVTDVPTYRRAIGMVFQNYALFPHMTVASNIGYGLRMRRVARGEIARRVEEALDLVKLRGFGDRRPKQLSGGQQQRVALARALVVRPKVLLLDEPFSALDKNLRASMQVELKEIQRKLAVTTIFVTHDQSEALSLSDRIAVMSEGRIRQIGSPGEIYRRPLDRFVASFVGDVNVIGATLDRIDPRGAAVVAGLARVAVPPEPLAGAAPGGAVDLFVRPEDLQITGPGEPPAIEGVVATHVYQGGHVDLYVDAPAAQGGRLLVRIAGHHAMERWPVGARVALAIGGGDCVAFPREEAP